MSTSAYQRMKSSSTRMRLNETNDCGVVSLAIAARVEYAQAYTALKQAGRKDKEGTYCHQLTRAARALGFKVTAEIPKQPNGSKYTTKTIHKGLSSGRHVVVTRNHALAVCNGITHDFSGSRKYHVIGVFTLIKGV